MRLRGDLSAELGQFQLATGEFDLKLDGVTVVFGASGAGKSTLLRAVAGFLPQLQGQLYADDEVWLKPGTNLPAERRGVGLVFQEPALFPHMNVAGNLAYAARRSGASRALRDSVVEQTGLQSLLQNAVTGLSGGQRQRVALARTLLGKPRLLCLDEPLTAVDWAGRHSLLSLIESVAANSGIPVLYVTHAAAEAERLARRLLFMREGRIESVQNLQEALSQADSPLFEQDGAASVLLGSSEASDTDGVVRFCSRAGVGVRVLARSGRQAGCRLRIRARDVSLALKPPEGISILNQLPAQLQQLTPLPGGRVVATLQLQGGEQLLAEITAISAQQMCLQPGDKLYALIKTVALMD